MRSSHKSCRRRQYSGLGLKALPQATRLNIDPAMILDSCSLYKNHEWVIARGVVDGKKNQQREWLTEVWIWQLRHIHCLLLYTANRRYLLISKYGPQSGPLHCTLPTKEAPLSLENEKVSKGKTPGKTKESKSTRTGKKTAEKRKPKMTNSKKKLPEQRVIPKMV